MALFNKETDVVRPSPGPVAKPDLAAEPPAHLDRGSRVKGTVSFSGSVRLDGEIDGEIVAKGDLNIGEAAVINAQITAGTIVVSGKVSGNITGSRKIELCPSAQVAGNLAAPVLAIHEGARFEGHCSMPGAVQGDEKVRFFAKERSMTQIAHGMHPGTQRSVSDKGSNGSTS